MSLLERHDGAVREQRGYDGVADAVCGLDASYCRQRFAFTSCAAALADATPAETLVSVGLSPTSHPLADDAPRPAPRRAHSCGVRGCLWGNSDRWEEATREYAEFLGSAAELCQEAA